MPKFIYKAKKGPGEVVDGVIDAEDFDSAVDKVTQMGLTPIDVALKVALSNPLPSFSEEPQDKEKRKASLSFLSSRRIKQEDIAIFTRQLSDLIDSGVPILRAITVVLRQTQNPSLKEIIAQMQSAIQDGGSFSHALSQHEAIFSKLYSNMVRSGELGGNLNVVLNRLAEFIDKDQETRAKVRASLIYPALILVVGVVTIFILLSFVIPRLTVMFDDLSQSLPLPTMILVGISDFLSKFWWLVLIASGMIFLAFKNYLRSAEGKKWFDELKLKLPLLGSFIKDAEIGRFSRTLGTLLDCGVTIVPALEAVSEVLGNEVLKAEIKKVSLEVAGGSSLNAALKGCAYFPEAAIHMIAVGEESGRLEQSLYKLADSYERSCDRSVKTITSLLEPLLIVLIGSVVGFIVISMLLPIFKMDLMIR
ncbi:MAG: type II secretion system F family protein [Candidatus Omnitrophota bacterium]